MGGVACTAASRSSTTLQAHLRVLGIAARPVVHLLHAELVVDVGVQVAADGAHVRDHLGRQLRLHGPVQQPLAAAQIGDQRPLVADDEPALDAESRRHAASAAEHAAGADDERHAGLAQTRHAVQYRRAELERR